MFEKRDFLLDELQRYRGKGNQKPGSGFACNLDFAKKEGLEPKVKRFPKLSKLGDVVDQISLIRTYHRREFFSFHAFSSLFI